MDSPLSAGIKLGRYEIHPQLGAGGMSEVYLARAAALSGDTAQALKSYQDIPALCKDADSDLPILQQAKGEYEKLK